MQLAELARDPTLVPTSLSREERSMRGGFIVVRVRTLRAAVSDPADIPNADVPALRTQLTVEITQAVAAYTAIHTRVNADAAAGRLLPQLDDAFGLRIAGRFDEYAVHQTEDRRVGSQCQRDG